jgi:hypothetical protein
MVVLFIAVLQGLASALIHERIFFRHPVQGILLEESRTPHRGRKGTVLCTLPERFAELNQR